MLKKHLIIENHWKAKIVLKVLWLFILTEDATGFLGEEGELEHWLFPCLERIRIKNEPNVFMRVMDFSHFLCADYQGA